MASASSLAHWSGGPPSIQRGDAITETVEIDPQLGAALGHGFSEGDIVSLVFDLLFLSVKDLKRYLRYRLKSV